MRIFHYFNRFYVSVFFFWMLMACGRGGEEEKSLSFGIQESIKKRVLPCIVYGDIPLIPSRYQRKGYCTILQSELILSCAHIFYGSVVPSSFPCNLPFLGDNLVVFPKEGPLSILPNSWVLLLERDWAFVRLPSSLLNNSVPPLKVVSRLTRFPTKGYLYFPSFSTVPERWLSCEIIRSVPSVQEIRYYEIILPERIDPGWSGLPVWIEDGQLLGILKAHHHQDPFHGLVIAGSLLTELMGEKAPNFHTLFLPFNSPSYQLFPGQGSYFCSLPIFPIPMANISLLLPQIHRQFCLELAKPLELPLTPLSSIPLLSDRKIDLATFPTFWESYGSWSPIDDQGTLGQFDSGLPNSIHPFWVTSFPLFPQKEPTYHEPSIFSVTIKPMDTHSFFTSNSLLLMGVSFGQRDSFRWYSIQIVRLTSGERRLRVTLHERFSALVSLTLQEYPIPHHFSLSYRLSIIQEPGQLTWILADNEHSEQCLYHSLSLPYFYPGAIGYLCNFPVIFSGPLYQKLNQPSSPPANLEQFSTSLILSSAHWNYQEIFTPGLTPWELPDSCQDPLLRFTGAGIYLPFHDRIREGNLRLYSFVGGFFSYQLAWNQSTRGMFQFRWMEKKEKIQLELTCLPDIGKLKLRTSIRSQHSASWTSPIEQEMIPLSMPSSSHHLHSGTTLFTIELRIGMDSKGIQLEQKDPIQLKWIHMGKWELDPRGIEKKWELSFSCEGGPWFIPYFIASSEKFLE